MNNTIRIIVILFAVMFFWIASEESFANDRNYISNVTRCFDSGGVVRCIQPDGKMTTIVKG